MSNELLQKENTGHLIATSGNHKYGDIISGFPYLPKEDRRKILLLSDDL